MHTIRLINSTDIPALHAIYAQYIPTNTSFEYSLPSLEDYTHKIETIKTSYPYLALEKDGQVIGFAYAQRVRERAAYQWSAELSIYLAQGQTASGLGSSLYLALMSLLKLQGIRTVYGVITGGNPISLRFHEKLGFSLIATFSKVGYKNGQWLDVHWVQKEIGTYDVPQPIINFSELDAPLIQEVLNKANAQQEDAKNH